MSKNLKSMTIPEIGEILKELGQPAFRAKQVFTWLHKGVASYEEMTNLPQNLRQLWQRNIPFARPRCCGSRSRKKTEPSNISGSCPTATAWKRY